MVDLNSLYFVLLVLAVVCVRSVPVPKVRTPLSTFMGTCIETRGGRTIQAFLGIPYAKPPLGDLRFKPPELPEPLPLVFRTVFQPNRCVHGGDLPVSEDCLYLNVYTPEDDSWPLMPVLVYFAGGAGDVGAAVDFTPEFLLDEDIVYVVIQYRLGFFGFLSTGDEVMPGNMGLKDLRMGLKWVKENIYFFGGDPDKITIFGQSAGAIAVHAFMLYLEDEGLFRAAITHSGSLLSPLGFRPPQEVRKTVDVLATLSDCPTESVGFLECLKNKPVEELVSLYEELKEVTYSPGPLFNMQPCSLVGPVLEPDCVQDRIVTNNPWHSNTSIPWLVGVNSAEANFYFTPQIQENSDRGFSLIDNFFNGMFPSLLNYDNSDVEDDLVPAAVRKFYLNNVPISRQTLKQSVKALTDAVFTSGVFEGVLRANQDQTYMFYFDYLGANEMFSVSRDGRVGASHGEELFLFFPHPIALMAEPVVETRLDFQLSRTLIKMWTNFVMCLEPTPSHSCSVQWQPFSRNQSFLHIQQDLVHVTNDFFPERMAFWQSQPYTYSHDEFGSLPCRPGIEVIQLP